MKINIVGKNVTVTEGMRTKIMGKLSKLEKYEFLKPETICKVMIRTVKDDQIIEVTIPVNKTVIRVEKRDKDLYAAIDMVEAALTRKIRKEKERLLGKKRVAEVEVQEEEDIETPTLVKEKVVPMVNMTPEEAADQMEALDHDFHLFVNSNNGKVSVLYRRRDRDYGMICAAE